MGSTSSVRATVPTSWQLRCGCPGEHSPRRGLSGRCVSGVAHLPPPPQAPLSTALLLAGSRRCLHLPGAFWTIPAGCLLLLSRVCIAESTERAPRPPISSCVFLAPSKAELLCVFWGWLPSRLSGNRHPRWANVVLFLRRFLPVAWFRLKESLCYICQLPKMQAHVLFVLGEPAPTSGGVLLTSSAPSGSSSARGPFTRGCRQESCRLDSRQHWAQVDCALPVPC